jgi:hypothetical protein
MHGLHSDIETDSLKEVYAYILIEGVPEFGAAFKYIRDHPDEVFSLHWSPSPLAHVTSAAGKDRPVYLLHLSLRCRVCLTDRLCAELISGQVSGAGDDRIAKDYVLTRVGREPQQGATISKSSQVPLMQGSITMLDSCW